MSADSPERPNVLVVLTDQQRWDTVGAYGSPMDLTPNLDAMAEAGVRFERAFSSNPLCAPQRASLQTGRYGTENGVWRNAIPLEDPDPTLAGAFGDAGYETAYVGKWHLATTQTDPVPEELRAGYEDYWVAADTLEHSSHPYEGVLYDGDGDPVTFSDRYRVDALTDYVVDYLTEERDPDSPFFLFLSQLEPHHQNDMETYVAPDGYAERYANPWVPPDLEGRPGDWYAELPDYYGICRRLDESLGRILDALEAEGVADETIVLFTSDHGSHFRTRNREYKRSVHEGSIRVPAVMRGPGFEGGEVVDDLVSLLDVPPTLLDAAGVDVPEAMQGDSAVPLVDEDDPDWKEEVFVQVSEASVERGIRTDRWKYSVYAPDRDGWDDSGADEYVERYLYDLAADPHEQVNLVGREDYREVADELRERLRDRMVEADEEEPAIRRAEYYA